MNKSNAFKQATLALAVMVGSLGTAQAQSASGWSLEVGGAASRAATLPLDVALGPTVQVAGRTVLSTGQAVRVAVGRQFARTDDQGRAAWPWRLELEFWQHSADRESVSVGLLQLPRQDALKHSAVMLNVLVPLAQSEAKGAEGQPDWRAWVGLGFGQRQTQVPDASSSSCACLPARSDSGAIGQVKLQMERRLGESAFVQFHMTGLRINGFSTEAGRFPQTRYGDQSIGEYGLAVRWVF